MTLAVRLAPLTLGILALSVAGPPPSLAQVPTRQAQMTSPAADIRASPTRSCQVPVLLQLSTVLPIIWDHGGRFQVTLTPKLAVEEEPGPEPLRLDSVEGIEGTSPGPTEAPPEAVADSSQESPWIRLGGHLSWADEASLGLGARAAVALRRFHPRLRLVGSFDYFFPEDLEVQSVVRGSNSNTLIRRSAETSYFEVNAGLAWSFRVADHPTLHPYAGGGPGVARTAVNVINEVFTVNAFGQPGRRDTRERDDLAEPPETDVGLNLFAGLTFETRGIWPFGELRLELGGGDQVVLAGGVVF